MSGLQASTSLPSETTPDQALMTLTLKPFVHNQHRGSTWRTTIQNVRVCYLMKHSRLDCSVLPRLVFESEAERRPTRGLHVQHVDTQVVPFPPKL